MTEVATLPPPNPETRHEFHGDAAQLGGALLDASGLPIVLLDDDLDHRDAESAERGWKKPERYMEVVFSAEPNGDTRIGGDVYDRQSQEPKRYGHRLSQKPHDTYYESTSDALLFHRNALKSALERPHNAPLYRLFGIRYNAKDDTITYASEQRMREGLADLDRKTGWAPGVQTFSKQEFSGIDRMSALSNKLVPLSGAPEMRIHDLMAHAPFYAALPKETFDVISQNAAKLLRAHEQAGSPDTGPTREAIARYSNSLELVNEGLIGKVGSWKLARDLAIILNPSIIYDQEKEIYPFSDKKSLLTMPREMRREARTHARLFKQRLELIEGLYPGETPRAA